MNIDKATEIANEQIDYLVSKASDIPRDSITLCVEQYKNLDKVGDEATVQIDIHNKIFIITINITAESTEEYIVRCVCHEFGHISNWEWLFFYWLHLDEEDDSKAKKHYDHTDESTAYRQERLYYDNWELRNKVKELEQELRGKK